MKHKMMIRFADAIDELIPKPTEALQDDDHDILMTQRDEGNENADGADPKQKMPLEIKRFNKGVWKCVCKIDYAFVEFANLRSALLAQVAAIRGFLYLCLLNC
ncbi:hypothetical protein Tco_1395512, partial [Tanacetum coccineum]